MPNGRRRKFQRGWSKYHSRAFRVALFSTVVIVILIPALTRAQLTGSQLPFRVRVETGYERTALNYNLLQTDTASLSEEEISQILKSTDTRIEPVVGVRVFYDPGTLTLENAVFYGPAGWREHLDGGLRLPLTDFLEFRSNGAFAYEEAADLPDSILSDYWTLSGDARLLGRLSSIYTIYARLDWERLRYPHKSFDYAYDYNRTRYRIGGQWRSEEFDFADVAVGTGHRAAPDTVAREYDDIFASAYFDLGLATGHRLILDAGFSDKDYRSNDPRDDYQLSSVDIQWEYRARPTIPLTMSWRWDFWNFGSEDEVTYDFAENDAEVKVKIPLGDYWAVRLGPRYRFAYAIDEANAHADYRQPSGKFGIEYISLSGAWFETGLEIGRRHYRDDDYGYSDYTLARIQLMADARIGQGFAVSLSLDYEKEFHTDKADDTDFLFFSLGMDYTILP